MSDSETTADLSDKNCTGDELDHETSPMPKVVSQSTGIGNTKRELPANDHVSFPPVDGAPIKCTLVIACSSNNADENGFEQ